MPKKPAKKKPRTPKVRKIILPADEIVRIHAPPGTVPVAVPVARNVIEIAPVPAKKKTLWQSLFG